MTRTRRLTLLYSAARAGFGLALLVPPSWAAERWIGRDAGRRPVAVAMAGLAARDLALALGAIDALRRDGAVAPWLVAASACDLADIAITLAAGYSLPGCARWGTPVLYSMPRCRSSAARRASCPPAPALSGSDVTGAGTHLRPRGAARAGGSQYHPHPSAG